MKTQKQDLGKVSLTCNGTWDAGKQYDRLCIVNDGNFASYISKKDVPIGTVLSDERFWQPIANLRDDIKIDYETFKKEWLELLASIQIKLRSARVVVANKEARNNLTWLEVAAGCEVYELDTQLTYILDSIVPVINLKSWHLVVGSLLDSEAKFQLDGTYELTAERAIADRWGYIIDEVYVSKKEVKNLVLSIVNDKLENMSITIPPNSITPEDLSQAVLDLIGSGGNVVNNPDEEDITSESLSNGTSVLKFKDRDYVEGTFNGLGEIILRKNQVGIVNLLEQVNINKPNTIYIIRYDFCLGGATITLPKNSTLKFEGGSIDNGTIIGNNSSIISDIDKTILGKDLIIEGTWNIEHIYDRWFAFDSSTDFLSNQIITNILALSNDNVYNTIHFDADRTYYFENTYKGKTNLGDDVRPNYWLLNTPDYDFLRIFTGFTSNTHLIVNNTIQMLPTNQGAYFIFHIENKENITISGTGAINGDAKDHLYTDPFAGTDYYGEWGHVLNFRSCNNVVVRDITIGYAFGDGIALGNAAYNNNGVKEAGLATKNVTIDAVKVLYARRNGISLGGNNYTITNVYFEGNGSDTIKGTAPMAAIDFENDYVDIEPSGLCTNVSMNNCKFKDNKYDVSSTIRDDLYEVPRGELVNISDCNFTSPLRLNRTNGLTFSNCHIVGITNVDNSIAAWYSSKDLIFSNCIFDELNPYLTISAEEQNKKFINPTYPEDIRYSTTFQHNLPVGKALKFTIPKPLVGEVEFTAFCSNPNYSAIQMPINTTIYTFGPSQRLTGIRDIKIKASQDSTPRYSMYKNTPVFSYINYIEDSNNFIIYFAIGGDLIGDSYASATSVNIFLTSKTKFITVEAPVSGRLDYAGMYGGKWSELSAIIKESVEISSILSTVTFPSKEMYSGNMLADLPTSLTPDKVGFSQFVLDGTYKRPVFWDSYSNVFRTADGNKALERRVTSLAELDILTAKLTVDDRGYVVYYTVTTSYLTWRGSDWTNEDGSLFSKVKYIKQTNTIDILNVMFSYSNVIYKICADIDLGGGTLTIATNSTLDFQGGSFSNGNIVFQNTTINRNAKLFISASGTIANTSISLNWFGLSPDVDDNSVLFSRIQDLNCSYRELTLEHGNYNFSQTIVFEQSNVTFRGISGRTFGGSDVTLVITVDDVLLRLKGTRYQIKDITFAGSIDARTASVGLMFSRVDNPDSTTESALASIDSKVENCQFYNLWRGIYVLGNQIRLSDLSFSRCMQGMAFDTFTGASPMYYGSNGRSYVISRCNFHSMVSTDLANGCIVILNRECICFQISGCHQDCETHFIVGQALTRSTVEDNMIANVTQGGIRVSRIYNSIITGNSFLSSLGTDNPVINDSPSNRLRQGIYATVDAFSSIISNNYFDYCNMEHIRLEKSLNITITGNTFRRWGQSITEANKCALWLPGSTTRVTVTANTFEQDIQANSYLAYIQDGSKSVFADNIINTKNGAKIVRYTVGETVQACFNIDNNVTSDIIVPTSDNISSIDSVTNKEGFFYVYNNSGGGLPLGIISADITVRRITIDKLLKVLIPFDLSYGVWTQVVDLTNSTITKWTPMNKALTRPVSNYSNFDSTDTGALHWDGTSLKIWNGTSWTNVDGTTL
jgi:hypothetical protein